MHYSKEGLLLVSLTLLLATFGCSASETGNSDTKTVPYEATLVDSHGNGGWLLFDSAPNSYDRGHSVTLVEETKVRVTGGATKGLGSEILYPVTVLSGTYTDRSGWVISKAIP